MGSERCATIACATHALLALYFSATVDHAPDRLWSRSTPIKCKPQATSPSFCLKCSTMSDCIRSCISSASKFCSHEKDDHLSVSLPQNERTLRRISCMTDSSEPFSHCLFLLFTEEFPLILHLHFSALSVHDLYPYALMTVVTVVVLLLHERSVFTTGGKWVWPFNEDRLHCDGAGGGNRTGLAYDTTQQNVPT